MSHGHGREANVVTRVAYAMAIFPEDQIQRSTLRALMPVGHTYQKRYRPVEQALRVGQGRDTNFNQGNSVTIQLGGALRILEKHKQLIKRDEEIVHILDHEGLWEFAYADHDQERPLEYFISLDRAIGVIKEQIAEAERLRELPRLIEARRRDLIALHDLMVESRNDNWSGRGSVRFVPKGRVL